ncbi:MAG: hypothetical protein LBB31_01890 [Prevotellaceae bacterium]|jgi:uncharacterized protein (TIGR02145 family)|nr:hypothetical protein [Prevotellaceae bacterium]
MNILKGTFSFSFLWCGIIACCLLSACSDEDETTSSTGILSMQGAITANIHDYAVRNTTLFLKAEGITTPTKDKITYQWTIADPASSYVWGQVIKYQLPGDTENAVTVTLSGTADGYYGSSSVKAVTLIEDSFAKTVDGLAEGATTFTDTRDGQIYQYAHIGNYYWMTQNLNWADAGRSYKNQSEYDIIFGRLYSWEEAVNTTLPVCPTGWQLPDTTAWNDLGQTLNGGAPVTFESYWQKLGSYAAANAVIREKKLWPYDPNNTKENKLGWNALPAGEFSGGVFSGNGRYGHWWSDTPYPGKTDYAYSRYIIYNNASFYFVDRHKQSYLSVRCVRTTEPPNS